MGGGGVGVFFFIFFFFNDTATTEIYTLSLHDALPIFEARQQLRAFHTAVGAPLAFPDELAKNVQQLIHDEIGRAHV